MPFEYEEAWDVDDRRRPYMSPPALRWGEPEILGFVALSELYEGLLARLMGGGAPSDVEDREGGGRAGLPALLIVGMLSLLLALRLGSTLFLIPRPVTVSPLSGNRIGM